MKSIKELRKEKGVLVAAHRGTSAGNIPPNSIAAFDIGPEGGGRYSRDGSLSECGW